ncbi:MAG: DNA-binding CsgD family transcriptional regulator, partial [bacterium]
RRAFNLISSKKSNDEIAKMTGYSLSYIKKNKSRLATSK